MKVTPETAVLHECMLAASACGCRVWRNNTGVLIDRTGRPVRYGLCVGSADIIGLTSTGRFVAIECKAKNGRTTPEQENFLARVVEFGGIGIVARCGQDVTDAINTAP